MMSAAFQQQFDGAEEYRPRQTTDAGWPVPDMTVLRANLAPAVPFPAEVLGSLWPLALDLAAGAGAPVEYVATSMLAVAASLVGAKRWVRAWEGYDQPCILWLGEVGDPSTNKSPGIDATTRPLRGMEADLAEHHRAVMMTYAAVAERAKQERKAWEEQVKTATKDCVATPAMPDAAEAPDAPERTRLVIQDATPEEMAAILAGNPTGTLHLRDELAGWLDSFERYSAGGRAFWLEAYGGLPFVVDRKSLSKPLMVPFNGVSVLGGIQPEKLRDALLGVADDGLVARFLWVWPEAIPFRRPRQVADRDRQETIYRRLQGLSYSSDEKTILPLDAKAADMFELWIAENDAAVREAAGMLASFMGKGRGHALRLALVLELLAWADAGGPEPTCVGTRSMAFALQLIDDFFKPHARRVFGDASLPPVEKDAAALARYIVKRGLERINARELQRDSALSTLKSKEDVEAAIGALAEAGWLREAPSRQGSGPGRQRKDHLVNPAVHGGHHR